MAATRLLQFFSYGLIPPFNFENRAVGGKSGRPWGGYSVGIV